MDLFWIDESEITPPLEGLWIDESEIQPIHIDMSFFTNVPYDEHIVLKRSRKGKVTEIIDLTRDESYYTELYIAFVKEYGTFLFEQIPNAVLIAFIARGAYGSIYEIQDHSSRYIIKMERRIENQYSVEEFKVKIENEYECQDILANLDYAPHLYSLAFFTYKNASFSMITMEKIYANEHTVGNLLQLKDLPPPFFDIITYKLFEIIDAICRSDIIHGDLQWNNIFVFSDENDIDLWNYDNTSIKLVDFGWSVDSECDREFELLSLLQSTYSSRYAKENRDHVIHIINEYMDHYHLGNKNTRTDYFTINDRYNLLFNNYQKKYLQLIKNGSKM